MNLIRYAFLNIKRRPIRNLISVITIALGIAAIVAMSAIAWGFEASWQQANDLRGTDLIVTRKAVESAMPSAFNASEIKNKLNIVNEISEDVGLLSEMLSVTDNGPPVFVFGWERPSFLWDHLRLIKGAWPNENKGSERETIIGVLLKELIHKDIGDTLSIEGENFKISGIFESQAVVENGATIMSLNDMQVVVDKPGKVNVLNLRLKHNPEVLVSDVQAEINALLPKYMAIRSSDLVKQNTLVKIMKAMSLATMIIAWLVGLLIIFNAMLMSVNERTKEVGILLSVGWKPLKVIQLFSVESVIISFSGGFLGVFLGITFETILQNLDLMKGKINPELSFPFLILMLFVSVVLGVVGGFYPALKATQISPAVALRAD